MKQESDSELPGFFERVEREKSRGKAAAEQNRAMIERLVRKGGGIGGDRYQASWAMRNMIRALEMLSWKNTVEDWQRYFEAKIIMAARSKLKRKKNPHSARARARARGEIILMHAKVPLMKGTRAEVNRYITRHFMYPDQAGLWEIEV